MSAQQNMPENLLAHALHYAGMGYRVFPTQPNTPGDPKAKAPLTNNGLWDGSIDENTIRLWWERHPTANIAIRTEGLVVVDTDPGSTWLHDFPDLAADLLPAPQAKTPRGGSHRIFRQPPGKKYRNTTCKLAPHVDTRANGGYILVYPSVVDDKPYEWVNELDDPGDDLPHPPEWLIRELDRIASRDESPIVGPVEGEVVDDGGIIPEGSRNDTLTRLGGAMRRVGFGSSEIEAALLAANIKRCVPRLSTSEVRKIAWSVCRYEPDQISVAVVEGHFEQDRPQPAPPRKIIEAEMSKDLLAVPGFIGKVAAYTNATSHRLQPDLAFAGALCLLAALTGRKIADEQDTRTNIYAFGLAPSGGGKDRARQVNKEILRAADGLRILGQESFASQQGMFTQVELKLALLCQVDELGEFMKAIKNPKNSHIHGVVSEMLKLYSSANTVYMGPAHADSERDKTVDQPHMVFYGTTVSESFFDSITIDSISNGFLSRAFFFEGSSELKPKRSSRKKQLPEDIVKIAKEWLLFNAGGNMSNEFPKPKVVKTSTAAQAIFKDADEESDAKANELKYPLGTIWTRVVESARKLALLRACSRCGHKVSAISKDDAEWAVRVAKNRAERMEYLAETRVSDGEHDSLRLKLLRIITEMGQEGCSGRQYWQKTKRFEPSKRDAAMKSLLNAGDVTQKTAPHHGPGRQPVVYVASSFIPLENEGISTVAIPAGNLATVFSDELGGNLADTTLSAKLSEESKA